jgi:hypothetical protein
MGAEEYFKELLRRNCRYVALRSFEGFPNLELGEDIDLLVADDDLGALEEILHPAEGAPLAGFSPRSNVSGHYRCIPELVKP